MHSTIRFFALLALSSFALCSAQLTIKVTPQSLSDWTLTGADLQSLSNQPSLSLPAGAQLARSFPSGDLALKITTQPQFGAVPADWPVIELGSAALVFASDGTAGRLSLVVDDGAPVDLPGVIRLDANGRSVEPLAIEFMRKDGQVTVTAAGQKLSLAAGPVSGPMIDVVASAGAGNGWAFDRLEVVIPLPAVISPAGGAAPASDSTNAATGLVERNNDLAKSKTNVSRSGAAAGPDPTGALATAAATAGKAGASTLEIFTPPAVRHGRADAVRNAVATGLQK